MARYQQVADSIRGQIAVGTLSPGDRLPTEPELVNEYAVSRLTVRHAVDVLQAEGLVEKFHGRGTFVRRPPERAAYVSSCGERVQQPAAENTGFETYVRPSSVLAEAPLTALMRVDRGTELAEYMYFSRRDKRPYSLARIYVPTDLAVLLDTPTARLPWGDEIPLGLGAAGVRLAHITERVTTRPPTQDEAEHLNLPPGATVLEIERTSVDDHDRVVEGARLVAPQDRIEVVFSKVLSEPNGGGGAR